MRSTSRAGVPSLTLLAPCLLLSSLCSSPRSQLESCSSSVISYTDGTGAAVSRCSALLGGLDEATLLRQTEATLGVDWSLHQEIFSGMHVQEKKHRVYNVQAKYLKHRRIIVDWMCEVGEEYKLSALCVHCAVRYLDRILSTLDVAKNQLQLVAMSAILIAAKYEVRRSLPDDDKRGRGHSLG